ncbi:glycine--tRNA ligase beta subunit [Rhodanobacter panaciterrae]|uniref:Glycine--tRNA ligase beta subunit n=1 Tax=Rhodanobacter panaciterrae TaxID=490572 RepID=A0ABQ3A3Z5_9GAMM|nr:glycine--tRNA ligase subunit beta [Rhodanobacter panaciterrae]GGY31967.1 glycine--tRNA ligase beta subunit [Rhodanobacter panaciterrae]
MAEHKPLLIELGTEELPPKALDELSSAFLRGICDGLAKRGIDAALDQAKAYCSPRRLAAHIPGVAQAQPEQAIERRGPAMNAALDADGQPSKALHGFAQSCGVGVEQLEKLETDKGAWFVFRAVKPGQPVAALLPEIIEEALKGLPIPRPMRWADHDYSFVRPVHWLVILHGAEIVDGGVLGLKSGRKSRGHRFMHSQPVHVADADSWLDAMRASNVLADPQERRQRIRAQVEQAAKQTGGVPRLDDALLDEIANLTEWPVAIACTFEREFLAVPPEALVTTMETNQKFVPVFDAAGKLTEHFIGIANIDSNDPAEIRKGYERVIRPRFADAKFFWDEDLKTPLASYQEQLKSVTYQQALGSLWDKSVRVAELARVIANRVGVDAAAATRAASLSKCDLLTRMVGEFPELQGVMGRYYASHHGESAEVAEALDSYYQPRYGGDAIAAGKLGQVLAVAERLDTLAGIFAVGMKPGGSKDPFALRRAALGLARTLIEAGMELDLRGSLVEALEQLPDSALAAGLKPGKDGKSGALNAGQRRAILLDELYDFVLDRLRGYYAEQGFDNAQFEAVLAVQPSSLADFDRRLRAVAEFGRRPEAVSLAAANKRVANILRKQAEEVGAPVIGRVVDPAHFEADAERELADALASARLETAEALGAGDYTAVLARLSQLQAPVDTFFDSVLVNADNPAVRANRLALLGQLKAQFSAIADIALL